MRCTRCDGLAVPQRVGLDPEGRVVFGWCEDCLARGGCRLVEVAAKGPSELRLGFGDNPAARSGWELDGWSSDPDLSLDQSRWIVAVVALLMVGWGLILVSASLHLAGEAANGKVGIQGKPVFLGVGGGLTAVLGLGLLQQVCRQGWRPARYLFRGVSWFALICGTGMVVFGWVGGQRPNWAPLLGCVAVALVVAVAAWVLAAAQGRKPGASPTPTPWPASSRPGRSRVRGSRRLG